MKRERGLATRTGINKQGWETSDFPVACDKCYGENPYMRMLKENYGQECRICFRPFTVFKWKGNKGIYKRTCVCSSCSKDKNICQVCTLDLEFGLPMDVRDRRCGKNGAHLINDSFLSSDNQKAKPPPPAIPPPPITKMASKELVFVTEENEDEEEVQLRVAVQGDLLRAKEQ
jgi:hypothetical protein